MNGILFFCHGARQSSWRAPFDEIVAGLRRERPQAPVALGFLELMEPDFFQAIESLRAQQVTHVQVIPLFLAPGSHTQRDLPDLLAQAHTRWPELTFDVAPTLTESVPLRAAIVQAALTHL